MRDTTRTFVLTGLVVVMLLALHILPDIAIGGIGMRHVNILSQVCPEPTLPKSAMAKLPQPPTPPPPTTAQGDSTAKPSAKSLPDGAIAIDDYSGGNPGGMAHFREALTEANALGRPVRVAYYGDSFIEGDILTCDLREMLQQRHGGGGVGWIDCDSKVAQFRPTIKQKSRGIVGHDVMTKPFDKSRQSFCQRYFVAEPSAWVEATATHYRPHLGKWTAARLYLRTDHQITVATEVDGQPSDSVVVEASPSVQMVEAIDTMSSVAWAIEGASESTTLFGMSLETGHGVIVDNLSMRGSPGYRLSEIPSHTLADFARLRPYDLIVLHFGLNVVSEESSYNNFSAYAHRMEQAVKHLQAAYPEASILIVSVSDRDQRTDEGITTLDGIEPLVAYQQIAAANCGVAFFNLYKAMGGAGSMATLVDRGWANKDYTHLSFAGGRYMAKLIFEAIVGEAN